MCQHNHYMYLEQRVTITDCDLMSVYYESINFYQNGGCLTSVHNQMKKCTKGGSSIIRINFIEINMHLYKNVFYYILSLQKHRVCVKGTKTISRHQKLYAPGPRPPVYKFLDPPLCVRCYMYLPRG